MDMIFKIKKLSRMSVLVFIAISVILLTGCGKAGTPPPGAALTIKTVGKPDTISMPGATIQNYRVAVADADGTPLQGVNVNIQASFTSGDNITFNGVPGATSASVETGDFGFKDFTISAPTFSFGPLDIPVATAATALASGGTVTAGTFTYGVTATDAATPPGETTISNTVSATTTTTGSSITITWQAVPRASGYFVYGDGGTGVPGALFRLTVLPQSASSVCNALTLVCSFTDKTGLTGAISPPLVGNSGQGLNPVTGTLTATAGALLTTLDISQ